MEKITLTQAQLVSWVSQRFRTCLDPSDIEALVRLTTPTRGGPCERTVRELMCAIASGRKIEAIKSYRVLTDVDLKEAKDAVEASMNHCARRAA
jgi:ribosomal protein L7/L12